MPFTEILGDLLCIGHFLGIILYTMNFFSNVVFLYHGVKVVIFIGITITKVCILGHGR